MFFFTLLYNFDQPCHCMQNNVEQDFSIIRKEQSFEIVKKTYSRLNTIQIEDIKILLSRNQNTFNSTEISNHFLNLTNQVLELEREALELDQQNIIRKKDLQHVTGLLTTFHDDNIKSLKIILKNRENDNPFSIKEKQDFNKLIVKMIEHQRRIANFTSNIIISSDNSDSSDNSNFSDSSDNE